jgi:cholest-4-en-3-one 26-monooxygenase
MTSNPTLLSNSGTDVDPDVEYAGHAVFDPQSYVDGIPHRHFDLLRAKSPVHRVDAGMAPDGFWAVTRHADVVHVSRNADLFSSQRRTCYLNDLDGDALAQQQLVMVNMDPPEHTRLRSLVNRGFTPRTTAQLAERVTEVTERIVDEAIAQGEGDFVTMCAAELPLVVIAELLGVPQEDRYRLFDWSNRLLSGDDPEVTTPEDQQAAAMEIFAYAHELGETKRGCPKDDIVTRLISPDTHGQELSELEFDVFFLLLTVAGNETTRNAISGGMHAFINHPEQWELLRRNPSLVSNAADEVTRWVTPVNAFRRVAMTDTVIGEQEIAEGDNVVIFYSSANRDELVFTDPHTFDITRPDNAQLAFGGGGPHFCLGRHLAKLELEIMLGTLARRIARVELTGEVNRLRSQFINGIKEMPVRIHAA